MCAEPRRALQSSHAAPADSGSASRIIMQTGLRPQRTDTETLIHHCSPPSLTRRGKTKLKNGGGTGS
ncbi:MAG TPA: hypothetical protein VGS58_00600, partial [Candidatus Sulfopaludibacter sp.]|nr:hypothetical protein [Candidatus Sulfopaludibacter sp.]